MTLRRNQTAPTATTHNPLFYRDAGCRAYNGGEVDPTARPLRRSRPWGTIQEPKPMPDDRGVVREIAWQELFPWLSIVRSARLRCTPADSLGRARACFVTAIGWRTIGGIFSGSEDLASSPRRRAGSKCEPGLAGIRSSPEADRGGGGLSPPRYAACGHLGLDEYAVQAVVCAGPTSAQPSWRFSMPSSVDSGN